jgi:Mn2+/Fe2+ NRAMP family transporter
MLPLPMIPLIIYTQQKGLMTEFVIRRITALLAVLAAITIIMLNIYLLNTTFKNGI